VRRGDHRLDPSPAPRQFLLHSPVIRGHATQEVRSPLLGVDAAHVVLLPNRSSSVVLVMPEIEVPSTVEIPDASPTANFHFIPLSRGMLLPWMAFSGRGPRKCSVGLEVVGPAALPFELFRVEFLQPRIRVDVVGPFVVPDPRDPREPHGEPARVVPPPL